MNTSQKRRWDAASAPVTRKRARQSCEACKARKTKCVGIENGACEYCRSLDAPCEVSLKSRKRPFYKVSEEDYECSIKLLRRFVPEEELPDLTVENITSFLDRLDDGSHPRAKLADKHRDLNSSNSDSTPDSGNDQQQMMEPNEHPLLQEELGCMMLDSLGKYRYVGADSSLRWHHAARMASARTMPTDPRVVVPLQSGLLPPTSPESAISQPRGEQYLPCRQLCMHYVARFFQQVHSMHCLYSPEQFYTLLERTLEDRGTMASASWLCSLYSIFAMGSMRPNDMYQQPTTTLPEDRKSAADYLMLAKEFVPAAAEEADIESVRAFSLLSLAMHSMCYSLAAYLYLGTAARIGFSLGLHRDIFSRTLSSVDRERYRRVWWTLYVLDYEMASRFGYPCAISDDTSFMKTSPASEQILDPAPNVPLGYQALSVSLVQLRKKISFECFLEPTHIGGRLPINRVTQSLTALKTWLDNVPRHLRWDSSVSPQHLRSISVLHLRYWSSIISITRPFLLFSVTQPEKMTPAAKRKCYDQLSVTCIEAAEMLIRILQRMQNENALSSVTLNDCYCAGEAMWILVLALQRRHNSKHQDLLRKCVQIVSNMEKIGWCEKILPDIEARVRESGVLDLDSQPSHRAQSVVSAGSGSAEYPEFNFEGSQWDVLETLDLDTYAEIMNIFPEDPLAGSMGPFF